MLIYTINFTLKNRIAVQMLNEDVRLHAYMYRHVWIYEDFRVSCIIVREVITCQSYAMHNSNRCLHPYNNIGTTYILVEQHHHPFIKSIPASVYLFSYTYMLTFMMAWFPGKHARPKCDVIPHLLLYGGLQVSCKGQICITLGRKMTLERVATGELPITWMANVTGVLRYTKPNVRPCCPYGHSAAVFIIKSSPEFHLEIYVQKH